MSEIIPCNDCLVLPACRNKKRINCSYLFIWLDHGGTVNSSIRDRKNLVSKMLHVKGSIEVEYKDHFYFVFKFNR